MGASAKVVINAGMPKAVINAVIPTVSINYTKITAIIQLVLDKLLEVFADSVTVSDVIALSSNKGLTDTVTTGDVLGLHITIGITDSVILTDGETPSYFGLINDTLLNSKPILGDAAISTATGVTVNIV